MNKRTVTPLMIFGIAWLVVVAVSWKFIPGWQNIPGGFWTLAGVAAIGVLAFLKDGREYLKSFFEPDEPPDKKPDVPSTPTTHIDQQVREMEGGVVAGTIGTLNYNPAPVPETHDTIGFVPPAKTVTYIPRGKIEQDVISHIRRGNRGAIVGLHAPGGLGKTELAKKAAEELKAEYEVLWVDVGTKKPIQVIGEMLTKCGVQSQPTDSYEHLRNELQHAYQTRKFLVILDDVRKESLAQIADVLPPSPCAALVTSRIQQIGGVENFELDVMNLEQAQRLFEAVLGEDAVANELETVKMLAERCKFNPLAMEIAARRIRQFEGKKKPVRHYFEIARAKFSALKMEGDARWDMEHIFDISYGDLSGKDQENFQILSAFHPTGFSLDAVAFVWKTERDAARNTLSRFSNLSLVKLVATADDHLERHRLHDLLDEYAAPKLRASGGEMAAKTVLAQWLVELFGDHYTDDVSNAPQVAMERDNLLHACEWARGEKQAEILALLTTKTRNWFYVNFTEAWVQWYAWLEACLQLGVSDKNLQANVRKAIGDVQQFRDDRDAALESYNEALKLFKAVGAKLGEANVLSSMGRLALQSGDLPGAERNLEKVIEMRRSIRDIYGEGADYGNFAISLLTIGEKSKAKQYALRARQAFLKVGEATMIRQVDELIAACEEE